MEDVGVILLTYERMEYAKRTLAALREHLNTDSLTVRLHIADDGSKDCYREELYRYAIDTIGSAWGCPDITMSNSQGYGYGASYNLATQAVHHRVNYVLPIEDDWELTSRFDLASWLTCFNDPAIGCVRFGYLGFTGALRGTIKKAGDHILLCFSEASDEHHVCAGHPRIERVQWARSVGAWTEGLDPGSTEREWCGRPAARKGVAWPMEYGIWGPFAHIGSIQARKDQT